MAHSETVNEIWRKACVGREGYCSPDLQDAARTAIADAIRMAATAARSIELPPHFQWSESNGEKFYFGRDLVVEAIEALL